MDKLIFLDTETTGNNLLDDRLFQVAYSHKGQIVSENFKPALPISIKAQSITHVTNEMIADKKSFSDSEFKKELEELLKENIIVAHNAQFDLLMLAHEGIKAPQFICTLKVVRFLDAAGEIPEYNLQYLRYHYELNIKADAHSAEGDVLVLEALFKKLYEKMMGELGDHETVIKKMIEISGQPSLFKTFPFGKYRGRKVEEVAKLDKPYLEWLLGSMLEKPEAEEDWIFTLKHYLRK